MFRASIRFHVVLFSLSFSLVSIGCQTAPEDPAPAIFPVQLAFELNDPEAVGMYHTHGGAITPEFREFMETRSTFRNQLLTAIHSARNWEEAHRAVGRLIEQSPQDAAGLSMAYREQLAAGYMLHLEPLRNSPSAATRTATAHYTELLIRHESPEVALVVEGLRRIEGHIPEETYATMVHRALSYAEARLAQRTECQGCGVQELRARLPHLFSESAELKEARLAVAVWELDQLASASQYE